MESAKAGAVAGEGKVVTSERSSFGSLSCGAPERFEAVTAKTVAGEQTGRAHGAPKRGAQYGCMPVVSKAGNRGGHSSINFMILGCCSSRYATGKPSVFARLYAVYCAENGLKCFSKGKISTNCE